MASEYRTYLAANVLNEDQVVTYRLLSRALNVHVNEAKEMLYEFHRDQNGKKPGTIHATYIVAGTKRKVETTLNGTVKDGEDDYMQSSPFQSSPVPLQEEVAEHTPVISVILAREEHLDQLRSQYDSITSIHMYSLGPSPLKDLQVLSDSARVIHETYANEDPLEHASNYGTIVNKCVRRRTGRWQPLPTSASGAATAVKLAPSKSKPAAATESLNSPSASIKEKENPSSSQLAKNPQSSATKDFFAKGSAGNKAPNNPPPLKRDNSSIFKSFAKATPKLRREETDSSAAASGAESVAPSGAEDEPMKDMSEDEEDNYVAPVQPVSKETVDTDRKSRKDREAALRKMMDEEESEDEAVLDTVKVEAPKVAEPPKEAELKETLQMDGGRKRGRRRVMKKKTVKDEEGYLVTREEPAWESFSEEEVIPPKPKTVPSTPSNVGKPKKAPSKPNQGNIMSFFGKK